MPTDAQRQPLSLAIDRVGQIHHRFRGRFRGRKRHGQGCHDGADVTPSGLPVIAVVGSPNVGKSVTFHKLTGLYAVVSNYPGTTVEVTRARGSNGLSGYELVDTPGMYSLLPITDEERVARAILLDERPAAVIHVVDAKNLERMLPFTLMLIEANLPVILNLNIMDEAERLGIRIDVDGLSRALGVPVIATVATSGRGIPELRRAIDERVAGSG